MTTSRVQVSKFLSAQTAAITSESRFVPAAGIPRKYFLAAAAPILLAAGGCKVSSSQPITLGYAIQERETAVADLSGCTIAITPFLDGRTDPYVYKKRLVLAEGQNAGVWLANALKVELEHAGATVVALPKGATPGGGRAISGHVTLIRAQPTGWHLGGILAALIGTGYMPHVSTTVEYYEEGVPVLSKQYDIKKNVPSNAGLVIMVGVPPAHTEVPKALAIVLKELIREKIIPELAAAIKDDGLVAYSTLTKDGELP